MIILVFYFKLFFKSRNLFKKESYIYSINNKLKGRMIMESSKIEYDIVFGGIEILINNYKKKSFKNI